MILLKCGKESTRKREKIIMNKFYLVGNGVIEVTNDENEYSIVNGELIKKNKRGEYNLGKIAKSGNSIVEILEEGDMVATDDGMYFAHLDKNGRVTFADSKTGEKDIRIKSQDITRVFKMRYAIAYQK